MHLVVLLCFQREENLAIDGFHASWELRVVVLLAEEVHIWAELIFLLMVVADLWILICFSKLEQRISSPQMCRTQNQNGTALHNIRPGWNFERACSEQKLVLLDSSLWSTHSFHWRVDIHTRAIERINQPVDVAEVEQSLCLRFPWDGQPHCIFVFTPLVLGNLWTKHNWLTKLSNLESWLIDV